MCVNGREGERAGVERAKVNLTLRYSKHDDFL